MKNCWKNIMKFGKKSATSSNKEFYSIPVYIEKHVKTKTKSYFLFVSWSIRNFLGVEDFFYFLILGWKVHCSISRNIKKVFLWENKRIFLILKIERSISGNIRNFFRGGFFYFGGGRGGGGAWAGKCARYNHFHNSLRLFDVLTSFSFTTSETLRGYYL